MALGLLAALGREEAWFVGSTDEPGSK